MPKGSMKKEEKTGPALVTGSESQVQATVQEAEPTITFDRWFAAKGYKPHWKAGMAAFTDTTGRKTAAEWDAVFKSY